MDTVHAFLYDHMVFIQKKISVSKYEYENEIEKDKRKIDP